MGKIKATVKLNNTYEILKSFYTMPGDSIIITNTEGGIEVKLNNYFIPGNGIGGIGHISKLFLYNNIYIEDDFELKFYQDNNETYLMGDIIFTTNLSEQQVVDIAKDLEILNIYKL